MNELMQSVINGSDIGKAVFLMITGISFVFAVQLIFYAVIRIFTRIGEKGGDSTS